MSKIELAIGEQIPYDGHVVLGPPAPVAEIDTSDRLWVESIPARDRDKNRRKPLVLSLSVE
jgi:hypothetical protein